MKLNKEQREVAQKNLFSTEESKLEFTKIDSPTSEDYKKARQKGMEKLVEENKAYDIAYHMSKDHFVG